MKKLLSTFIAISFATTAILAQDAAVPETKGVRFGVFVRGTPSWYTMPTNNYYSKGGAVFGMGFGLNLEFKITNVVSFQTGIGGDFDGGKIKYSYSGPTNNDIYTGYYLDKTPQLVEIKGTHVNDANSAYLNGQYTRNYLVSRRIHTSYVTIPILLKMMTKEINGFKYFVDFGGSIGVLVGAKADDVTTQYSISAMGPTTMSNNGLSMYKDCIPVRIGLNVGLGAEYRLAGTTSLYLSANFVNSFIPTLKSTSVYNTTGVDYSGNSSGNFLYSAPKVNPMGIQINLGVLF